MRTDGLCHVFIILSIKLTVANEQQKWLQYNIYAMIKYAYNINRDIRTLPLDRVPVTVRVVR